MHEKGRNRMTLYSLIREQYEWQIISEVYRQHTCIRHAAAGICLLKCFCLCFCCTFRAKPEPRIPCGEILALLLHCHAVNDLLCKEQLFWLLNDISVTYSRQGKKRNGEDRETWCDGLAYPCLRDLVSIANSGYCNLSVCTEKTLTFNTHYSTRFNSLLYAFDNISYQCHSYCVSARYGWVSTYHTPPQSISIAAELSDTTIIHRILLCQIHKVWWEYEAQESNIERSNKFLEKENTR